MAIQSQLLNPTDLSDDEIIKRCHSSLQSLLSEPSCSNKVVKISSNIVVKFGPFVKRGEFLNQKVAFQRLNPSIIRVPAPHRFIQNGSVGYLVMDFAKGEVPSTKQALALAPQLSRILSHLHEMEGETPGSLGGDAVQGVLWPGNSLTFKDRENFENWLTRRLRRHDRSIKFEDQQLVMCHLDFVPRNMVVDDGAVTLLDWASSGYFPRIFDYIAYNFSPLDTRFFANLLPHLGTLADLEEETAKDVLQALDNCQIYFL